MFLFHKFITFLCKASAIRRFLLIYSGEANSMSSGSLISSSSSSTSQCLIYSTTINLINKL